MMCGGSPALEAARQDAAAIQPACLPITSRIKTLVDVSAMLLTSSPASSVDVAIYFATEPNPGEQSV